MEREIKFRALRTDLRSWVYGDLNQNDIHHGISIRTNGCIITGVVPESVGQYTGLKDKNGAEIYEGDIVKWGHLSGSYEDPIRIAVVSINPDISFTLIPSVDPRQHVFHYGTFIYKKTELALEVIGNIHESTNLPLVT